MKKIYSYRIADFLCTVLFSCFFVSFSQTSCNGKFTGSSLYSAPSVCYPRNNNSMMAFENSYKIFYRTNEPVTASNCSTFLDIKKPILLVEGFDFRNEVSVDDLYRQVNSETSSKKRLLDTFRSHGYDVIAYNISNPLFSIETNASQLIEFIKFINVNKQTKEELIIMGVSMGGLVVRYALTEMEVLGLPHHTKLFLSLDAPQSGAYLPLSIQELVYNVGYEAITLSLLGFGSQALYPLLQLRSSLLSDAAKEMLKYDVWSVNTNGFLASSPCHEAFINKLRNKNRLGGYPENCKNVAISNGSFNGERNIGFDQIGTIPGNIAIKFDLLGDPFRTYELRTVAGNNDVSLDNICIYRQGGCVNRLSVKDNPYSFESAPGGFGNWYDIVAEVVNSQSNINMLEYHTKASTFIPLISAMDLYTSNPMVRLTDFNKQTIINNSPFDDIFWDEHQTKNTYHTSLTVKMADYILNQVLNSTAVDNYCQKQHLDLSNLTGNVQDFYEASGVLSIDNTIIDSGGDLTLKAGESIVLKQGFWAKSGSKVDLMLEPCNIKLSKIRPNLLHAKINGDVVIDKSHIVNVHEAKLTASISGGTSNRTFAWFYNDEYFSNKSTIVLRGFSVQEINQVTLTANDGFQSSSWKKWLPFNNLLPSLRLSELDDSKFEISVYPNPTDGEISLEVVGDFIIHLYDMMGKEILTDKGKDILSLNLHHLQSGNYVLKIETEKTIDTFSIQIL